MNGTQSDWSDWLPIAQYTHNTWPSDTTGKTPFELIMGFTPRAHQALRTHEVPALGERSAHIQRLRWLAHKAVKHAQSLLTTKKGKRYTPYQLGDKVWLEGTNLAILHFDKKFKPRRYGPFIITKVISNIVYELVLPSHWKIHNVFHASLLTHARHWAPHPHHLPLDSRRRPCFPRSLPLLQESSPLPLDADSLTLALAPRCRLPHPRPSTRRRHPHLAANATAGSTCR
jgi:hypothetical protein